MPSCKLVHLISHHLFLLLSVPLPSSPVCLTASFFPGLTASLFSRLTTTFCLSPPPPVLPLPLVCLTTCSCLFHHLLPLFTASVSPCLATPIVCLTISSCLSHHLLDLTVPPPLPFSHLHACLTIPFSCLTTCCFSCVLQLCGGQKTCPRSQLCQHNQD